jgi:hypothetical protein
LHIDLPYHWAATGESMWGRPLGEDLYELHNVPFLAYGLSFGDVVRATPDGPGLAPEIRRVVIPGGHQTLRLFFADSLPEQRKLELLQRLGRLSVGFERGTQTCFALDLTPEAELEDVLSRLEQWRLRGWCEYETCEPRVAGSFDDRPEEHTH